jgi:hypothetical protein
MEEARVARLVVGLKRLTPTQLLAGVQAVLDRRRRR